MVVEVRETRFVKKKYHTLWFQNDEKIKYISIKMEPKGSTPEVATMNCGRKNHCRGRIGRGTAATRHGNALAGLLAKNISFIEITIEIPTKTQT